MATSDGSPKRELSAPSQCCDWGVLMVQRVEELQLQPAQHRPHT